MYIGILRGSDYNAKCTFKNSLISQILCTLLSLTVVVQNRTQRINFLTENEDIIVKYNDRHVRAILNHISSTTKLKIDFVNGTDLNYL